MLMAMMVCFGLSLFCGVIEVDIEAVIAGLLAGLSCPQPFQTASMARFPNPVVLK